MITLTERAVRQIQIIQAEEKKPGSVLRIRVAGGGCSGMSYKLDFDTPETVTGVDKVFHFGDLQVAVDPKSYLFLQGMEVDFSAGLNGKGFTFANPNAKKSCGCGSSFSA